MLKQISVSWKVQYGSQTFCGKLGLLALPLNSRSLDDPWTLSTYLGGPTF